MKKSEVVQLLEEVDKDGSGEVDYSEFLQIMTTTLGRNADEKEAAGQGASQADARLPFSLMATAYRRKRLMEGLVSRDKTVQTQMVRMAAQLDEKGTKSASSATSYSDLSSDLALIGGGRAEDLQEGKIVFLIVVEVCSICHRCAACQMAEERSWRTR